MDQMFEQLIAAVRDRVWYPVIAIGLSILISFGKALAPKVWSKIPKAWRWLPIVAGALAGSFVDAYQSGLGWQVAIGLAVYAAISAFSGIGAYQVKKSVRPSATTGALALLLLTVPASLTTAGCAGSLEAARVESVLGVPIAPRDVARCEKLDDEYRYCGMAGKTSASLAGGAGLASVFVESSGLRSGLQIGSVVAAGVAAGAILGSEAAAESWARKCSP